MIRLTRRLLTLLIAVSALALVALPMAASASTAPGLGTAASYAVLAGTTVTNTGDSVLKGDLGISPGSACTGLPAPCTGGGPGTVSGTIHAGDVQALQAQNDLIAAYGVAASSPSNFNETGKDLGNQTLTPGTYTFSSSAQLTGTVTLNGNGVYIFQIGSTLITAPGATVHLTGDAQPCNVFWQVGSSATLDTTTTFVGTIMALTDISLKNGASIKGRALARNGQVTLINNLIEAPTECGETSVVGPTASPTASPTVATTATPTATLAPVLATTGGGPQNGVPWILLLFAGYCIAGFGLIVRERGRRA